MKTIAEDSIYLKGGSYYITQNGSDAFRITRGRVFVYIVPVNKGKIGRRIFLCEAEENEVIPAFAHQDMDYQAWRFCLVAYEEAVVTCMPGLCTNPLKNKFINKHQISDDMGENFENTMVDFYRKRLVQEDAYAIRTEKNKKETERKTTKLLRSLFEREEYQEEHGEEPPLYRMIGLLCRKSRIPIAPYETVKECCGDHLTVMDIARISHFPCREVLLEENWYRTDAGALIVFIGERKEAAACVQKGQHHYMLYRDGERPVRLTKKMAETCDPKAYMVYRPFLEKSMGKRDFFRFCLQSFCLYDVLELVMLTVVSALIGLLLPMLNQKLYDEYIPMGQKNMVIQIGMMILAFMMGNIVFSIISGFCKYRLQSRVQYQVQNAMYYRAFQLPEAFFRNYESADLAKRVSEAGGIGGSLVTLAVTMGISMVTAAFYLWRIFSYSPMLSAVSLIIMFLFSCITYMLSVRQIGHEKRVMELDGKSTSILFQFIQGIEKIRISGIEERAVYEYLKSYVAERREETRIGWISNIMSVLSKSEGTFVTLVIYLLTYQRAGGISIGVFAAFTSAFGYISGMIQELMNGVVGYKELQPAYDRLEILLDTVPETAGEKRIPSELQGNIDINHISFSYSEETPEIFHDLSLQFREGDYIGIVGESGCGKSTLLKLLLGFEKPVSGKIYYDDQDMSDLNLQELRKRFGVVLQDGELISGSIFENITLTAPWAGMSDVSRVVEEVGLAEDISQMPMGLQTIVSENCNTISGGQKQRILIARALINEPKVIFFDEATSALDNITQSKVCETLERIRSTKIVIAHRLSTIRNCSRILVLDKGNVIEDGSYEELMDRQGIFYQMASRQVIDF